MRRALKDRLAAYKIPQEMRVLESIPRNAMGKGESFLFFFLLTPFWFSLSPCLRWVWVHVLTLV